MSNTIDLYSIIGQLYVNLLAAQNANKQLEEAKESQEPPRPAPKPLPKQKKAEAISKTRDPVPL